MEHPRNVCICADCKKSPDSDFKKIAGLQNSGLVIFMHKEKATKMERGLSKFKEGETFILHNAGDKELKRADYIIEMCQYRTKCIQCRIVVKRVRSLLDEFTDIKRNEVLGICEHCKRFNPAGRCRRCDYIVNKFLCNKVQQLEDRQNRFKAWLSKVNELLHSILESENICRHKLYRDSSTIELEKLLQELRTPLEMRQPEITFFPAEMRQFDSITQSKEMIEELLIKIKSESLTKRFSDDSVFVSPSRTTSSCVCKYFKDKQLEGRLSMEVLPQDNTSTSLFVKSTLKFNTPVESSVEESTIVVQDLSKPTKIQNLFKSKKIEDTPSKDKNKLLIEKSTQNENISSDKESKHKKNKEEKSQKEKTTGKENVSPHKDSKSKQMKEGTLQKEKLTGNENVSFEKEPKAKQIKGDKLQKPKLRPEVDIQKMMKNRSKEKVKKEQSVKQEKAKVLAKGETLPQLKIREVIEVVEEKPESVVECSRDDDGWPIEMIKGKKVVRFDPHYKKEAPDLTAPILFSINAVFPDSETKSSTLVKTTTTTTTTTTVKEKKPKGKVNQEELTKGILKYALSNREFIEKGWTNLPTTKVMRRMNVYRMEPSNPKYDWFERHKNKEIMFYDTGEKLAEIDDGGTGKWFYKNGMIALDYYNAQELNAGQRYVIYSSGEEIDNGKKPPITVLASFDFLGNGVVYDHYGNARIKYNQSEGMVIDEKIGPRGRWQWHSLNDPPILQQVYIDSYVKHRNPCLDRIKITEDRSESSKQEKESNDEMLAIELDNFVKEKANKLLQKFKPFQIRMKALKINDQFSLRILDQANIYLLLRDGQNSLKLNLGMKLINTEIVDTDSTEVTEVATPYDQIPPKTSSVAEIQHTLNRARKVGRSRTDTTFIPVKKSTASRSSV